MKQKKLYYIPGLISIIGLPVLLFFFNPEDKVRPNVLKIFLPTEKKDEPGEVRFSREYVYQTLKKKKIITIDLDEYIASDYNGLESFRFYKKLDFVSHEIEHLQFTNDTTTVLKVQLGDNNTFGDFVWILNQTILYGVKRFAFVDNAYFLFANPPVERIPPLEIVAMDLPFANDVIVSTPTKWDIFKQHLKERLSEALFIVRRNYLYITAFLLLIVFPGIIGIRKNFIPNHIKST